MTDVRTQSRPAGLRGTNDGFQQEPPLTSTPLNVLRWSNGVAKPISPGPQRSVLRPSDGEPPRL